MSKNHDAMDNMGEHALLTREGFTRVCTGPCNQGRNACPHRDACQMPEQDSNEGFGAIIIPLAIIGILFCVYFTFA